MAHAERSYGHDEELNEETGFSFNYNRQHDRKSRWNEGCLNRSEASVLAEAVEGVAIDGRRQRRCVDEC